MNKRIVYIAVMLGEVFVSCLCASEQGRERPDLTETMKDSIVYLEISKHPYNLSEPWKHSSISEGWVPVQLDNIRW